MEINFRELLKKYVRHVGDEEGATFLNTWNRPEAIPFSDEEWAELQAIDQELRAEDAQEAAAWRSR